ncbi:MAG: SDR family oxidoreductase [Verrucomicrobia bacterium]|nr:SDR family oxidoreductase [Verrucomicrobiota bacterium]
MIRHHHTTREQPDRVVLLGAKGFIGRSLAEYFATAGTKMLAISSAEIDLLLDSAAGKLQRLFQPSDVLIFCSALTPDKGKDIRTFMKNLTMGEHVCAALSKSACSQVIYVSSDAVYGDDEALIRETTPCQPSSFHGLMHLARERMLQVTADAVRVPLMCVRPTAVYGVQDTHNSYGPNRFVRAACRGDQIGLFGAGEEQRDHLCIDDLVGLIGFCAMSRSSGTINAATGRSISFDELAKIVVSKAQRGAVAHSVRNGPITHRHFDVSALFKAFPEFRVTPLETGISNMLEKLMVSSGNPAIRAT